jgi:regulator of CtrA degradation
MSPGANPELAERPGILVDRAATELFDRTFREGMDLVAEVAAHLDGIGRLDTRRMSREMASDCIAESMRLTTRLMKIASWLLLQRALREGEISPATAADPRYRLGKFTSHPPSPRVPESLATFSRRVDRLFERVCRMDRFTYAPLEVPANPVGRQLDRLRSAFPS